jgi:hypothetical protein
MPEPLSQLDSRTKMIARNLLLGLMCMGKKMRGSKSGEKGGVHARYTQKSKIEIS